MEQNKEAGQRGRPKKQAKEAGQGGSRSTCRHHTQLRPKCTDHVNSVIVVSLAEGPGERRVDACTRATEAEAAAPGTVHSRRAAVCSGVP